MGVVLGSHHQHNPRQSVLGAHHCSQAYLWEPYAGKIGFPLGEAFDVLAPVEIIVEICGF